MKNESGPKLPPGMRNIRFTDSPFLPADHIHIDVDPRARGGVPDCKPVAINDDDGSRVYEVHSPIDFRRAHVRFSKSWIDGRTREAERLVLQDLRKHPLAVERDERFAAAVAARADRELWQLALHFTSSAESNPSKGTSFAQGKITVEWLDPEPQKAKPDAR